MNALSFRLPSLRLPQGGRLLLLPLALGAAITLSACDDGSSDEIAVTPSPSALALASAEPVGVNCAAGGARFDAGLDTNRDSVLEPAEVTSTQYVCNGTVGATGATGATGAAGANGSNGLTTLMRMDVEPAGANCPAGGTKVSVGIDANGNGVLDSSEVSGSPSYVCGGLPGAAGVAGANGADGINGTNGANGAAGTNGTNGTNGLSSLMTMTAETAGANCQYGGTKLSSGLDSNGNGVLDGSEITATSYSCNGAPGAGISWIDVSATTQQAVAGIGYLADSTAMVTITLPTTPQIGDLFQVSGVGAGGWTIAQNASQRIVTKSLPATYTNYAATWTPQAGSGSRGWASVASSSDGSKLAAVELNGQIYTSTDSGVTWTARDSVRGWRSVASSSDGSKLVAVAQNGQIYTSTDSGVTWTARDSNRNWNAVASSSDGSKLVAVVYTGQIYTSTDSGVTWAARDSSRGWLAVASSSDGSKLVAVVVGGQIYTSTDSGLTWTARDSARAWLSVASSSDGSKLAAVVGNGQIYTSTDSGVSWTPRDANRGWASITSSSDGSKLVAVVNGGQIYTSNGSGVTWTAQDNSRAWAWVAASSDGNKLVAAVNGGLIYTSLAERTTAGTAGSLRGSQYDAIELQYIGNNLFMPLSASSYSGSFTVN